ncbi:hypothetical protein EDF58_106300 [Novosphingobium sp. PhB57]|uniref:hypothetical protein n=1 Tax=unclassified Novosphingobium TaxID=2644732 RepID=UPI0010EF2E1E|nr:MULTISPECIES: hypothetical protein [unclassified Novosphingobium]TCU56009.1 hypothetical protein EDF58_106300 [Novosphingobium sp. PhB57]TDW65147.1 hypothetical protein EDF57_103325 [Novosphingobium sp. PhB55]
MNMNTTLYGECVSAGGSTAVRISDLASLGCAVETDAPAASIEGDLTLWIGAIGPFAATATRRDSRSLSVRFAEPLDRQIVQHFALI